MAHSAVDLVWTLASCALLAACARDEPAPPLAPAASNASARTRSFDPHVIGIRFTPESVRPGDEVSYTLTIENRGDRPAPADFTAFVHFETSAARFCEHIAFQDDRPPLRPTSSWGPGAVVAIGPRILRVPVNASESDYRVHAGLYDRAGGSRWIRGSWAGGLRVARDAPASADWQPAPLSEAELAERRARLAARLAAPVLLETPGWTFAQDARSGAFLLTDRACGAVWGSNPEDSRWGCVNVVRGRERDELPIERFDRLERDANGLHGETELARGGEPSGITVRVDFEPVREGRALRVRCSTRASGAWQVESLVACERAFTTTDADGGLALQPRQLGLLLALDRGLPQERRYTTYDDTSMAMYGLVRGGSGLLIAWPGDRTVVHALTSCADSPLVAGRRAHAISLELAGGSGEFELEPVGPGGCVEIARAYRDFAAARGLLVKLAEKRARSPRSALLDGAPVFRICALSRTKPGSLFNSGSEERVVVRHTFDEVARLAEHWRQSLGIDRARVVLAGWNRAGYDNELPDVLPAAEPCGGVAALADCARRVQACGFDFALQDNRQDMYRDAPSWDEALVSRDPAGELRDGGLWEGGRAYWICAVRQPDFACRDWPELSAALRPDELFLDTIFSVKLSTCSVPAHPFDRAGDIERKLALCALAREYFPLVSGEGGKEWGVPLVESFHGLLTSRTSRVRGRTVVPLFEMVYGDCVRLGTIMEDSVDLADAAKVLDHALCAEMPQLALDDHVYFDAQAGPELALTPEVASFEQIGRARMRFGWRFRVRKDVAENDVVFVHFRHPESRLPDGISFQDDFSPEPPTSSWRAGQVIEIAPREVTLGEDLEGEWEVLVGLGHDGLRSPLADVVSQRGRCKVGVLRRRGDRLEFEPGGWNEASRAFSRGDGGWSEGLGPTDRTIKNVFELLSPLCRATADVPMTGHRFLRADKSVEESRFGDLVVTVNYGREPYDAGESILGENGVSIASPTFAAFHALRRDGVDYPGGALFTLQSLDGRPLADSQRVRVWHGFGPRTVRVGARTVEVARETIVE